MNTEKFLLYWPTVDVSINQPFGSNKAYYARFNDFFGQPLHGHDGIDFRAPHGTPVYAAHDGLIHYEKDPHGGEGMVMRTTQEYDYKGVPAYYRSLYWHLIGDTDPKYPSPIKLDGNEYLVEAGDLIGYADNTGAPFESTGDHLHFGLFPSTGPLIVFNGMTFAQFDAQQKMIEAHNGFNGRIDPMPFFTNVLAHDVPEVKKLYERLAELLQTEVSLLRQKIHA